MEDILMIAVSIILSLTLPVVLIVGYLNRRGELNEKTKGVGWQFIRYTVLSMALPLVGLLAINDSLSPEAAILISGAMGYAFGKKANDD